MAVRTTMLRFVALVATLVLMAALPVNADAQEDDGPSPSSVESQWSAQSSTLGGASGSATIPGFYPVSEITGRSFPAGLALDPATGYLWVAEAFGARVSVFDHGHSEEFAISSLATPAGVAISDGLAYITEIGAAEVSVYSTVGTFSFAFGSDTLSSPCGIEVVGDVAFVVDVSANEVFRFDATTGTLLDSFDGADSGVALSLACTGGGIASTDGVVYVGDSLNNRVLAFDLSGAWLATPISGVNKVTNVDVDDQGQLWLTTFDDATSAPSAEVWTTGGTFVGRFDVRGTALGELNVPLSIVADPSGQTFWVGEGNNARVQVFTRLTCDGQNLTQVGTSYDDLFAGTANIDVVALGSGADRYNAGGSADTVCGGSDDDTLRGGPGDDRIFAQGGNDIVFGGGGGDTIYGAAGNDELDGQGGTDTIFGSGGDDVIDGRGALDTIFGGVDNDTINGQNGADEMHGGDGDDTIAGQSGPDDFYGDDGDDDMFGGDGNDTMRGGLGTDKCAGNTGNGDQAQDATCEMTPGIEILF